MQTLAFKVALRGISPMIWRRLRVGADTPLAELHQIIQIAMDWDHRHHIFHIYGRDFGLSPAADITGSGEPYNERLCDFDFDAGDRFTYISNISDSWLCDIRIEAIENVIEDSPPPRGFSGNGKISTGRYYKADEWRTAIRALDAAVAGSESITVDEIRLLLKDYAAATFNRKRINTLLKTPGRKQP